ncbi:MAG: hypothetical protein B1H05_03560 [Candidatus Cloacimonas sp. 4484_140]|nr:MAG: hypothetical protein B1H05_03560 [Candidatus Cloacimonas sp. 4484_140]
MKKQYDELVKKLIEKYPERKKEFITGLSEEVELLQIEKLNKIKAQQNNQKVFKSLDKIRNITRSNSNLLHSLLEAVKNYATLGEICNVLREEFDEFNEQLAL